MKEIPLVLVHGYPFDHSMWFSTIAALGSAARVIAPDLPGFGRSEVSTKKPSLNVMAEFIAATLDENEAERAVVAGMSMGGYVALAFAEKFPQRLAGLGLISTQTAADSPETKAARKETIKRIRAEGPSPAIEPLLPKMFSPEKMKNGDLVAYPRKAAATAGADGLCWALQAMADRPDRSELVTKLSCPVLVAHGSEDKIVPSAKARLLAETCLDPIFLEIRGAGHATPLEAPDQLAAALARLMRRVREVHTAPAQEKA